MKKNARRPFCGGFTLLEVLVVVLIAVLVTMFAVPSYRKAQERNRYLAALGVLMEAGNAMRMVHEEYPSLSYNFQFNANNTASSDTCPSSPGDGSQGLLLYYLQCNKYLPKVPFESGRYKGYYYNLSTVGTASCYGCSAEGVACMYDQGAENLYKCAYIDKHGNLHNN